VTKRILKPLPPTDPLFSKGPTTFHPADPIVSHLFDRGLAATRANYLDFAFPDAPRPLPAELAAEVRRGLQVARRAERAAAKAIRKARRR
jgi:hypothetical protein